MEINFIEKNLKEYLTYLEDYKSKDLIKDDNLDMAINYIFCAIDRLKKIKREGKIIKEASFLELIQLVKENRPPEFIWFLTVKYKWVEEKGGYINLKDESLTDKYNLKQLVNCMFYIERE